MTPRKIILSYLAEHPDSEVADLLEIVEITVNQLRRKYIRPMRDSGEIHISSYHVRGKVRIARYSLGVAPPKEKKFPKKAQIVPIPKPPVDPLTAYALGIAA